MSNNLQVTVGTFTATEDGVTEFGYTASDSYGRDYNFQWDTPEAFYRDHPTAASLWAEVLASAPFDGITFEMDEQGLPLLDAMHCPVQSAEALGQCSFDLCGYHPPSDSVAT